jgi:hypothetical protein
MRVFMMFLFVILLTACDSEYRIKKVTLYKREAPVFEILFEVDRVVPQTEKQDKKQKVEMTYDYNWDTFSAGDSSPTGFDAGNLVLDNVENSIDFNFTNTDRVLFLFHLSF